MTTHKELAGLVRDGQRARRRKLLEGCAVRLVVRLLFVPVDGFVIMVAVGFAHHEWWPALPTIGYWPAVMLGVLLRVFAPLPTNSEGGVS